MTTMGDMIDVEDLPPAVRRATDRKFAASAHNGAEPGYAGSGGDAPSFEDHERELLVDALERAEGNQSEAARILKISRDRMRYKMARYNLR